MKGTDHVCSLNPTEFQQLVKDVRVIEASLGTPVKRVVTSGKRSSSIFREMLPRVSACILYFVKDPQNVILTLIMCKILYSFRFCHVLMYLAYPRFVLFNSSILLIVPFENYKQLCTCKKASIIHNLSKYFNAIYCLL